MANNYVVLKYYVVLFLGMKKMTWLEKFVNTNRNKK